MAFILRQGNVQVEYFPKVASTAISVGAALGFKLAGTVGPALATSTRIAGVCLKVVASGDSDYASNTSIPVIVPGTDAVFEVDVTTGTATAANIGNMYDLDGTAGTGITVSSSSHNHVTVVGFISATKLLVKINSAYEFKNAS